MGVERGGISRVLLIASMLLSACEGTELEGMLSTAVAKEVIRETAEASGSEKIVDEIQLPKEYIDFVEAIGGSEGAMFLGMTFPIVDQPVGNPAWIAEEAGILTHFRLPDEYGVTALLAHNYLAGENFSNLEIDEEIYFVDRSGKVIKYAVRGVQRYRALAPDDPKSNFVDLNGTGLEELTAEELFSKVYTNAGQLVMQTCFENEGVENWGRLFVIAVPE